MDLLITLCQPVLYLMNRGSQVALRAFGVKIVRQAGVHSPDELKLVVSGSRRLGLLPESQEEIIHHALDLGEITAREVMVPRPDIFSFPADLLLEEAAARLAESQRSRVPVYDPQQGREHIIGVLHAKDVLRAITLRSRRAARGFTPPEARIRQLMREVMVVPESKPLVALLEEFKARKRNMAVVVDEFGSTSGLVTVEDVVEELVGEMEDEFDVQERLPVAIAGETMTLDGAENVRDLESQYDLKLARDQGFETLGGFVLARLQRIPRVGDSFEFEGRRFTVLAMQGLRVGDVRVEFLPPHGAQEAAGQEIA